MIVVSILASDVATLRSRALAQLPFADTIELRLDSLAHVTEPELRELITSLAKPVIAAVNGPDAFGTFEGTRTERFALLDRAARAGAAFVDVDWKAAPHQHPLPARCRRIVSRHVLENTPADLPGAFEELTAAARAGDLPKFVTHAHNGEDGARLLDLARTIERDFIAFASGDRGSFTRILAPIFGSQLTYAAPARVAGVDSGSATAPGQLRADVLRSMLPSRGLTRSTEIFAVLGLPARHSLSPRLHNAVFRAHARDAVYVAIEPDRIADFVGACHAPNWRGFSVTAPFKEAAYSLAIERDADARKCLAANTLVRTERGWSASNTDYSSLVLILAGAFERARAFNPNPRLLVVGNGGAARAAVASAGSFSPENTFLTARNPDHAATLVAQARVRWIPRESLTTETFDVIVHCTPAGSRTAPNEIAVPLEVVRSARIVVEAVYRPLRTPLVEVAEAAGVEVVLGSRWFLEQAVHQALHFSPQGVNAATVMTDEFDRALAEEST